MKTTFATARGAKKAITSVLVRVVLSDGSSGLGEVPTSFVLPHETPRAIKAVVLAASKALSGARIDDYPDILLALGSPGRGLPGLPPFSALHMTRAGLEVALFRAALAARRRSELDYWRSLPMPGRVRRSGRPEDRSIQTDITIPFLPDGAALEDWLGQAIPLGFAAYKIKVSGDVEADIRLVAAVRERLRRRAGDHTIRLDGNQGYTVRSYRRMIRGLAKAGIGIELFEQPLAKDDYDGLKRVRGLGGVPVILDETVCTEFDCRRVIEDRLADGVNVKIAKSGVAGAARIVRIARRAGLRLMIGCMTETMAGLSAAIRMAVGTGCFDFCDLDSIHFLRHRGRYGDISIRGSRYVVEDR